MLDVLNSLIAYLQFVLSNNSDAWQMELLRSHILFESIIAITEYSIPIILFYFVHKYQDLLLKRAFLLLSVSIIISITRNLINIWTIYHTYYWLNIITKIITVLATVYIAFKLLKIFSNINTSLSFGQLASDQDELKSEIKKNKNSGIALPSYEKYWGLLISVTNQVIYHRNLLTNEIFVSEHFYQTLGYQYNESLINYDDWIQLIHPDDYPSVIDAQQAYLQKQVPKYNSEYRLLCKDGNYKWFRSTAKALWDEQGNGLEMIGWLEDITERKNIERELLQSETHYRLFFENNLDPMWVFDPNNLHFLAVNPAAIEKYQYSQAEFLSMRLTDIRPQIEIPTLLHYVENSQMLSSSVFIGEAKHCKKDGTLINVEITSYPIIWAQKPAKFVIAKDITERKSSEADLKASEARFQEIAHTISQLFFIRSATTGQFIYVSPAYERIWGRSCESLYQDPQSWVESIHPEDRPLVTQSLKTQFAGNAVAREYRIIRPNGEIRWIFAQINVVRDEEGKILRFIGIGVDITERKLTEQALAQKENFLRSIYNAVGQSICVIDVIDNDFYFVGWNCAYEQITGLSSDEIKGKIPEEVFGNVTSAKLRQHYQDCLVTGTTVTYEECLIFNQKETWWLTNLTPLNDENSRIYRLVSISVNITQQRHTQKMLELQAFITYNLEEGICLMRANDGIIVYTNPKFEHMFGYKSGELLGQHLSITNYSDENNTAQSFEQVIESAVSQSGKSNYEVKSIKKDGTPFWSQGNISVFEHPEYGTVFVAVQQDITEQKQAQEQIKASLKEKEVLLQEIHHRVKNNLGIVSSLLQMQSRRTKDTQTKSILQDSQNRIASIALVHEKLYSSADLANINIAQYINDLTTYLLDTYNVNSQFIRLNIQVDDVSLDIQNIIPYGLIINELVSNAFKYAFPGYNTGEVKIILYEQNNNLILIIEDNGIGLPEDFDKKKDKTLGLTLVYGLVKQLKGIIEISSEKGTKFKLVFTKNNN